MKTLILTILIVITTTCLNGCVVVTERHHRHAPREVCVSRPKHPPIRPAYPPNPNIRYHKEWRGR